MAELINFNTPDTRTCPILIGDPVQAVGGSPDGLPTMTQVSTVNVSACLELQSTKSALLLTRMTAAQRDAIVTPADGMVLYTTDGTPALNVRNAGAWTQVTSITSGTISPTKILNGAGTTALPSYSFTGDTSTGIWHSGASTIDFSTAATEQFRIANTATSVEFLSVTGGATGTGLTTGVGFTAVAGGGGDANIDISHTPLGTGALSVRGATNAGGIRLWNQTNTFWSLIQGAAVASNLTWTWPLIDAAPPAGATTTAIPMTSNASGALSFALTNGNYATGTLTAGNINSMFTTGIQLLAAPGSGFAIIVDYFVLELVGATSFAAGGVVYLNYSTTGHGTTLASSIMPVTAITAASSNNTICSATGLISNTVTPSSEGVQLISTSVANQPVAITNAAQLFTTGTGTARWYIWYSVIPVS